MNVVKEIGAKIHLLRVSRPGRVTLQDLASKADISVSFLSMIENGTRAPHLETLVKIAAALQVPITELFRFDSDPDKIDALYRPLIDFCRKQTMTKKEVEKLIAVARGVFS
jgi:transcriptional regulator with XRE-family HTH domain